MGQRASPGRRPRVKPFGPTIVQGWPNPFTHRTALYSKQDAHSSRLNSSISRHCRGMEGSGSPNEFEDALTCRTTKSATVVTEADLMAESCRASRPRPRCQLSVKSRVLHCANVGRMEVGVPVGRSQAAAAPKTAVQGEDPVSRDLVVGARAIKNCTRPSLVDVEQQLALPDEHRRRRPRSPSRSV